MWGTFVQSSLPMLGLQLCADNPGWRTYVSTLPTTLLQRLRTLYQISGVWHLVSMASDNMTYIEEKGDLRLFIRNIQFLNNSNLQFDFHIMIHGECVAVTVVCEKTKNSGEFSIAYEGENKVLLVETDYTMYAIFHMQNIKNGTRTQVLALYGRFMQIDETYQERFENICKLYGLGSQNIIDMTNKDFCYL